MRNSVKRYTFALAILSAVVALPTQTPAWPPSAEQLQIPLWPKTVPDARAAKGPETVIVSEKDSLVAGKPWLAISNVSQPTMTVYAPKEKKTGAAVVVFPGGGYEILALDLEGTEVCDWLTSRGVTCVLLKYRVPAPRSAPYWGAYPQSPIALEDAQRAVGMVRFHAAEWGIDPAKIGVLGFSAGGHLAAAISNHFQQRLYPAVDEADKVSCRPDFAVAIYPGHLAWGAEGIALNPDIRAHISRQTPPTFLLQNEDDHVDRVEDSLSYFAALKRAGVPVEMHIYAQGGHAFGLRRTKQPVTAWPAMVETWLGSIGIIGE